MVRQDHEILNFLKSGEQNGMDALFERYYKPLVLFAEAYLHDLQGAEDLVQEQFVKLWEKRSFDHIVPEALSSFLFTVVKNACVNLMEKKKLPIRSLDLPHFDIAEHEAKYIDDETIELVADCLLRLPEKTRIVVECVMLKDKMYKETAEELGVSVNTVKTLLRNGIRDLRMMLHDKQDLVFLLVLRNIHRNK